MALDFPSNPVQGQVYNNFYWDDTLKVWNSLGNGNVPSILRNANIQTASASTVPMTVTGYASQSANLEEWKNSSGTTLSSMSALGALTLALPLAITSGGTGSTDAATARTNLGITPANINAANRTANWSMSSSTAVTINTTTYTTIASCTLTTNGRSVLIIGSGDANPAAAADWNYIAIFRDSSQIGHFIINQTSGPSYNNPFGITTVDSPSAGTYTYSLRACQGTGSITYGETGATQAPTIIAMELF